MLGGRGGGRAQWGARSFGGGREEGPNAVMEVPAGNVEEGDFLLREGRSLLWVSSCHPRGGLGEGEGKGERE